MIYPQNASDKLGFIEIKAQIKTHCLSEMGSGMVDRIQPISNFEQICKFLKQAKEFKDILKNDSPLPIQNFYNIKVLAEKARLEGAFLSEEDFFQVLLSLNTVFSVIHYFSMREGLYPGLEALF